MARLLVSLAAIPLLIATSALAEDWPGMLGPRRDGTYQSDDLAASWPASGPPILWRKKVGSGFSNVVVSRGTVILFHRLGEEEVVEALDLRDGGSRWTYRYPTAYRDDFGFDPGPRASPAISGGQVYTFGAEGVLHCLRLADGKKVWSLDTHRKFNVPKGFFGAACSPLVDGSRLFLNVGGPDHAGLVAFDKDTGRVLWTATGDEAGYSSPIAARFAGRRRILFFTREGLQVADPKTGEIAFAKRWRSRSRATVNAALPLVIGKSVFLSASYGTGAVLLRPSEGKLETLWSSGDALSNHYATSVHHKGFLYGFHGRQEYGQELRCIDLRDGSVRWSHTGFRAGTVTLVGGRLLILAEDGRLIMAEASPDRFKILNQAKILGGVVRAFPALANGIFYARNENLLVAVDLRK